MTNDTIVLHWPSFGPYHVARLRACQAAAPAGGSVIGLAVAGTVQDRPWTSGLSIAGVSNRSPENSEGQGSPNFGKSGYGDGGPNFGKFGYEDGDPNFVKFGYGGDERGTEDVPVRVAFPGRSYETIGRSEARRAVWRLLDELRPSVVGISGWGMADSRACLAWCRRHRAVRVLMSESKADDAPRVWWREWIKRRLVARFDAAVCGGSPHRAYLEQLGMDPTRIFEKYDVVDNQFFADQVAELQGQPGQLADLPGLSGQRPFFLVCSRLIARKNIQRLLAAYGRYRNHRPDGWPLVVLGTGHLQRELEQLTQTQGIPDVTFAGFRQSNELVAYYACAGALIHPALQEQWGLVVNEAMAAGLPVLVSQTVGSAADLVHEGVNGFQFDPLDETALSDRMEQLSHPDFPREAFGQASRSIIDQWTPEHFGENFWKAVETSAGR